MRGATINVKCTRCGDDFTARVADRKRGWAKFCSKSCKAKEQENRTGQHAAHKERVDYGNMMQSGYFGHGQE